MAGETSDELKGSESLADTSTEDESSSTSNDSNADSSTQEEEAPSLADAIAEGLELEKEEDKTADESNDADENADKDKDAEPSKDKDGDKEDEGDDELYQEPEGLQEKSKERFRALIDSHKQLTEELNEIKAQNAEVTKDVEDMRSFIDYSGATPEEFTELLEYSHLCKSGNKEDLQKALTLLDQQRESIASILGVDVPGVDVLSDYPDLQQAVDDMEITRDHALELAASRKREQTQARQAEQTNQAQQTEQASQEAILHSSNEVDALSKKWASEDIDFPAKQDKLIAKAKDIASKYPPNMWADLLTDYYNMLGEVAPAPKPNSGGNGNRPLRPSGGGSGSQQPSTMADAISQKLGLS